MRKLFLGAIVAVFCFTSVNAQNKNEGSQTSEGKWLIEANTNFGTAHAANTGIGVFSQGDYTAWNIGLEGGYFIMDDLAVKVGLGYGSEDDGTSDRSIFSYKVGAKYYIMGNIPVQLDYTGASVKDASEDPSYLGLQAAYAIFLGDNVSIEPGVRYNISMNDDYTDEGIFEFKVGFALHF